MDWQSLSLYIDILNKIITTLGIIAGGIWAYWTFVLKRTSAWNLQLIISPEVLPYNDNFRILVIILTLKNIGKVKIMPGLKGVTFSIKELVKEYPVNKIVKWSDCKTIIEDFDLLKGQSKEGIIEYEIEPGGEYCETEALIVPKNISVYIEATFWGSKNIDSDAITEYRLFHIH